MQSKQLRSFVSKWDIFYKIKWFFFFKYCVLDGFVVVLFKSTPLCLLYSARSGKVRAAGGVTTTYGPPWAWLMTANVGIRPYTCKTRSRRVCGDEKDGCWHELMTNEVSSDEGWSNSIYRWKNLDYKKLSPSWSRQEEPKRGGKRTDHTFASSVPSLSSIYTSSCIFYPSVGFEVVFSIS